MMQGPCQPTKLCVTLQKRHIDVETMPLCAWRKARMEAAWRKARMEAKTPCVACVTLSLSTKTLEILLSPLE
jgi:hypothetical protein